MGYDLFVLKGRLVPGNTVDILRGLTGLAEQLELEWSPFDILFNGEVRYAAYRSSERSEAKGGDSSCAVIPSRDWERYDDVVSRLLEIPCYRAVVFEERIQGLVIHHPYEDWKFMWNVSHEHALVSYDLHHPPKNTARGAAPEVACRRSRKLSAGEAKTLFADDPIPMTAILNEENIHLHTPWRRGDVVAAIEALRILEGGSEEFDVHDDYGVWRDGIEAWRNLGETWAQRLGGKPAHPDDGQLLEPPADKPGED